MAASTVYDVRLNLSLSDRLTPGVRRQTSALEALRRTARGTTSTLDRLAKAATLGFGIKTAYDWLIKYNAGIEDLKRRLSTVIMLNTGGDWTRSWKMSSDLVVQLREDAKRSAGTLEDMASFASAIANSVLAAGGNMQDLRTFTRQAVVAAAALGERADLAQLDITQALQGTLTQRDRFARALLAPQGITQAAFNKMSAKKRFATLMKGLNDPAIKAAAKSYEKEFTGVTSTLKDNLQQLAGSIGEPLFRAITEEIIKVNQWLDRNKRAVADFSRDAAKGLMEGFHAARRAVGFLIEHKDLLLALAKAYLVGKGVSILTGPLGGLGQLASAAGLAGNALGALPGIMGAVAAAATGLAAVVDSRQTQRIEGHARAQPVLEQMRRMNRSPGAVSTRDYERARSMGYGANYKGVQEMTAAGVLRMAREAGILKKDGSIDEGRLRDVAVQGAGLSLADRALGRDKKVMDEMRSAIAEAQLYAVRIAENERRKLLLASAGALGLTVAQFTVKGIFDEIRAQGYNFFDPLARFLGVGGSPLNAIKQPKPPDVKVDKLVIEVQSNDPDRFYMGIEGYFQEWVRNPSQAPTSIRESR